MIDIKEITSSQILLDEACKNAILSNSKKRRRQTFRLRALINDRAPLSENDSDVIRTVYTILHAMEALTMIRYGSMSYAEWQGKPPEDLLQAGVDPNHRYAFTSGNLQDPIQMYNDVDEKVERMSEVLLSFIFNVAAGIDLRNKLETLKQMSLEHINLSTTDSNPEDVQALERFATFVDQQNGKGAFAAGLMYPILNDAYGKKRKHALFGYGSNTGKGLLLAIATKLYVGAPIQMPVRPNERDVYSTGAWNKLILDRWVVMIGDSSESDLTYDFMKNLYEQPLSISGKNERTKEMFYGNVYIATNSQQEFFSDKEIFTRVFFLAMFEDVDQVLGEACVEQLDNLHRDSIVQYLIDNAESAQAYWDSYQTPASFYANSEAETIVDEFLAKYDGQVVPVRDVKAWINNPKQYKKLTILLKEYIGDSSNVRINGKQCRAYDLRERTL